MLEWFTGQYLIEITSADSFSILNSLNNKHIKLQDVTYCGDLVLRLKINRKDYKQVQYLAEKKGANVKVIKISGIYLMLTMLKKRPVLLTLMALLFMMFCYLPSKILFVTVEGNSSIPTNQILEAAGECGVGFWASRRLVRSEMMKNALLQKIPQLQWAGINTSGCTAVISVREKTVLEESNKTSNQVSSIVAARDGIIQNCTVYQGNPLCTVGDAVKAGQTLVSGYLDCGIVTKTTQANAEIKALTFRDLEVLTPKTYNARGKLNKTDTRYSLLLGKKLIKLYKDSGNLDTTCGKIYLDEYLHLPGGFRLPIAIVKETLLFYEDSRDINAMTDWENWLTDFAKTHLKNTMIAGEIISAQTEINPLNDFCYLYGKYACMEIIGQNKYEQTLITGDEND